MDDNKDNISNDDDIGVSHQLFQKRYKKVLEELDVLYRGTYDQTDAEQTAALCLVTQADLIPVLASSELRARSLKRDIDFVKAEAFARIKSNPPDGMKATDQLVKELVNKDSKVHEVCKEQINAEKEAKELANILNLLKDAHITFRSYAKKEI